MNAPVSLSPRDLWLLVLLTVLWGVNWPVMKLGVQEFPALSFRTLCMAGGVPLLWLIARVQGHSVRIAREHWRDQPQGRMGLGLLAAALAIAMLLLDEWQMLAGNPLGMVLMLAAAMVWGGGTQLMRRRRMQAPVVVIAFWMMVISVLVCSALSVVLESDQWVRWPNAIEWWAVLYNIVMVFGISQLLWFRLATLLPPVVSSL